MAIKLFSAPLPKGTGGRKGVENDPELQAALLDALKNHPTTKDEDGRETSQVFGDTTRVFSTEGRANADGRRYARPLTESLGKTVRIRVVDAPPEGEEARYGWVAYIPLTVTKAADKPAEQEAA